MVAPEIARRGVLLCGLAALALATLAPLPAAARAPDAPIPYLPIAVAVAQEGGRPVRDDAWIDAQIANAERLFGGFDVHFRKLSSRAIPERFARLETRKDRDALSAELGKAVINVMIVASLRDVDDPRLHRMGVHWRPSTDPRKHYVIVSADAQPTTLAHELGHYFGLGHSAVVNNLMSYDRNGDAIFLHEKQAVSIRSFARLYLRSKELAAAPEPGDR